MYSIIDLRGFVIRAYSVGEDEDGVYDPITSKTVNSGQHGFENFLTNYLKVWAESAPPEKIIFVLEGSNQLRKGFYEDYKAGRNATWSDIQKDQVAKASDLVADCIAKLGFLSVRQGNMEADDVIAYLAKTLVGPKVVHTVDGDLKVLAALKDTCVAYYSPGSVKAAPEVHYITDEVDGLPAGYVTLKKSIVGDRSDNYIGVSGMGEKAWDNIVDLYGVDGLRELNKYISTRDFEGLAKDAEELDCKHLRKLHAQKDEWQLGYNLARLYPHYCNSLWGRTMHSLEWRKGVPDLPYITKLAEHLSTFSEGNDWLLPLTPEYTLVTKGNFDSTKDLLKQLIPLSPLIGWDYETYNPEPLAHLQEAYSGRGDFVDVLSSKVTGVSFALGSFCNDVYYFSRDHLDTDNISHEQLKEVLEIIFDSGKELVAHNVQFEAGITEVNFGLAIPSWTDTSLFASHLWESDLKNLKHLCSSHLGYNQSTYQETLGDNDNMSQLTGDAVLKYACDDSTVTAHLLYLFRVLTELEGTRSFIEEYECKSLELLTKGFLEGAPIDLERLKELQKQDISAVEIASKELREGLSAHCSTANEAGALNLYKDLAPFEAAKLKADGKTPQEIEGKVASLQLKIQEESIYKELQEIAPSVEFKPTVTQINKVLAGLGLEGAPLEAVTSKGFNNLFITVEPLDKSPELKAYLECLAKCVGTQLKNREGDDYVTLDKLSTEVLLVGVTPVTVGTKLKLNSKILYGMLGLPIRNRTKVSVGSGRDVLGFEGSPSAQIGAVKMALAEDCTGEASWKAPILQNFLTLSKCATRDSFYWKPYPLWVHPKDGKIHPQIKQSATVTHRPTGTAPNILQVSKTDGGHVRSIFLGGEKNGEECVYVSMDFNGQELRILASESEDPTMLDAYLSATPKDIHLVTASAIALKYLPQVHPELDISKVPSEKGFVDYQFMKDTIDNGKSDLSVAFKETRSAAKTLNFGIVYGAGAKSMAENLLVPEAFAQNLINTFFSRYSKIERWKDHVLSAVSQQGYVQTVYGSRRHCHPDIISKDFGIRGRMERQVINFIMQGTAADILKKVLTEAVPVFESTGATLLGPIYDEIVARVPKSKVFEYTSKLGAIMNLTPPGHKVPMVGEVAVGSCWGYQEELGANPTKENIAEALEKL